MKLKKINRKINKIKIENIKKIIPSQNLFKKTNIID